LRASRLGVKIFYSDNHFMKTDLQGKVAVVTGGAKGYGRGIAAALRQKGVQVWITGRDETALHDAARQLDVQAIRADVTSPADWDRVFEVVLGQHGRLDILVNNAGSGGHIAPLIDLTDAEILQTMLVDLTGIILGCRRAAQVMRDQKSGTIINVSSVCQHHAWPGWSVYSAAKAGVGQFSKCLYTELREYGVRVTTLIPSWGATGFLSAAGLPDRSKADNARCIQAEELGDLVVTICELPSHLEIQDLTLWPLIQRVEPL
jgi:NAD(P)-dependent dehydrogenase (short-subunit alcohol dehydrogenase family)